MLEVTPAGLALAKTLQIMGITNQSVLDAMAKTPRHWFVDEAFSHQAWENTALPIGQGQTISQPYIVAKMTELLLESAPQHILEVGTGSGYQTTVLSQLVDSVCTIERIKNLKFQARRKLNRLDCHNVSCKHGDGWQGWQSKGPFDAIIVTAAASSVPEALLGQLKEGGRLVIPVGDTEQMLKVITRDETGFVSRTIEMVRFVPLINGELA
ncbi:MULTISPECIES: protein-L-isoaspartate(D-aspartate) O-methyltransferase [unclassified Motilimonas]|uniref:protein-L-isoaspartate(D-aspartate) O-methyltransferase n=1 Tax=Motilimonas TaxID=1914248 RepID=UPI001E5BC2BD|nr:MULTISPECIES: protein-L-isoaspartate(D-aspartate) O-methyltransferase [unclassified Motilimonas]MCE0558615.1 protein-L-isoaspartate(D-aspartate) O-methyltransferase [Motilimonas sp. E26]MDO6527676.1 protein-L-isoaspartate(D-aspartate) O-methyltransferase [Motilimonas sp. 1_MG-2023]